ncbi:hypothetical protein Bca52824_038667 [Brassica carinata]|uniref:Uncharacterized protein n=1 Tax=Brassica carinata TaxID=52824 RepID=A0A8X7RMJ9_BRACI|nr:hypothetical protein Bca52824_038667 [Brassica carinata]
MHASIYQRDIETAHQVSKANGDPAVTKRLPLLSHSQLLLLPDQWSGTMTQILDSITDVRIHKMKHTLRLKKTWQEATNPISAALSVGRKEFYALFIHEDLYLSSIPWKKEAMKSFEKVIKLSEKLK